MDLPPGPSNKNYKFDLSSAKHDLTDEELLNILENLDEDIDYSSESDLGEGDSGHEDCDPKFDENPGAQNVLFKTRPVHRQSTNYTWVDELPQVNKFLFSKTAGLKTRPPGNKPIDYFSMLFTDEFIELIVTETNLYAVEIFISTAGSMSSRISQWKDTTIEEMKIFFALLFHTGTIRTNRLEDYWKTSNLFNFNFFSLTHEQKSIHVNIERSALFSF